MHAEVGDGAIIEETAVKQLETAVKQLMEHLSIENEEEDNTDNITACANCGKEGEKDNMNICNRCKMVHYCNAACKKKHKSKHKKKCDRRVAELHDVDLFSEPPLREECPICFLLLPLGAGQTQFKSCCGKLICYGCIYGMAEEEIRRGKKKEEVGMCAFCRTLRASSDEEEVKRLQNLMEKGNAMAYYQFGNYYSQGIYGMPQDWAKANELWLKAGELGCAEAYSKLGYSYDVGNGVEIDKKKAKCYLELAAMKGDVDARHNLGCMEGDAGNEHRAFKHFMLAARSGSTPSLDLVKQGFMAGLVTKHEYGNTLRAYQTRVDEMKSKARDKATMIAKSREG